MALSLRSLLYLLPIIGSILFPNSMAMAQTASTVPNNSSSMSQVTQVNQLRDIAPTDWAYEALRSLVDRYGCIAGYPNQTYRGDRALSRYEFAAGLNACLNQIERLLASSEVAAREDLEIINRLTQELATELATIGSKIDDLEGRTALLEDQQFSTTTKLKGEVIFAVVDTFGDGLGTNDNDPTQTTFSDRIRLNLDSSFSGKDRLRVRLEAGNIARLDRATGFASTRLGFDANNSNNIRITDAYYRFPLAEDRVLAFVGASSLDTDDILAVLNPVLSSSGSGALSRFSRRNPIILRGVEGAGIGAKVKLTDQITFSGLYLTDDASDPSDGEGLFNGSFSTGGQLQFTPSDRLDLAFSYVYEYQTENDVNLTGSTGSNLAQAPFGAVTTRTHQLGLDAVWELRENIKIAGWAGGSFASEATGNGNAVIYTAAINVSLLDLGKEGAVLSISGGIPPSLVKNEGGAEDNDTSYLLEALYKFPMSNSISLTPGAYVIFNPDGDRDNATQVVGVLRTTFKF